MDREMDRVILLWPHFVSFLNPAGSVTSLNPDGAITRKNVAGETGQSRARDWT